MKSSIKTAIVIPVALALALVNLLEANSYNAGPPYPSLLSLDLKNLCNCQDNLHWVPPPNQLDRSTRPVLAPELDPTILPVDASVEGNSQCLCQNCFDCYAWQLFIALNWPAAAVGVPDQNAEFGLSGDNRPVVWETYKDIYSIFGDPNKTLPVWGECRTAPRFVAATSAIVSKNLDQERQADRSWLTDQNGNLVRYEIRINKDEYEYISRFNLNSQDGIYDAFTNGDGISLPDGTPYESGKPGSIEVKAAWRVIPPEKFESYKSKYKISYANMPGESQPVPIALVGLHIIKKTPHSPQFIWATFEHQDNAPTVGETPSANREWAFYNPKLPDDAQPNWHSPPNEDANPPAQRTTPVQVRRETEVSISNAAIAINNQVHQLIAQRFPKSIWLNYGLVDVQWPSQPTQQPHKPTKKLDHGNPIPFRVANVTMETYVQREGGYSQGNDLIGGPSSCIGCHRRAAITPPFDKSIVGNNSRYWWTDYSTIFFKAKAKKPAK